MTLFGTLFDFRPANDLILDLTKQEAIDVGTALMHAAFYAPGSQELTERLCFNAGAFLSQTCDAIGFLHEHVPPPLRPSATGRDGGRLAVTIRGDRYADARDAIQFTLRRTLDEGATPDAQAYGVRLARILERHFPAAPAGA